MDVNDFREFGKAAIDFIADYLDTVRDRPVLPSVKPGFLHSQIPAALPETPEHWSAVMRDLNDVIVPGMTHWQSPNFHAYYPAPTSYPAIIGEMLSAGFGTVGFSWVREYSCRIKYQKAYRQITMNAFRERPKLFLIASILPSYLRNN